MIKFIDFEEVFQWFDAGYQGTTIQSMLEGISEDASDTEYTVYWPRDSIRVIPGSSYGVARAVYCLLLDDRTRYMGEPTVNFVPELSRLRRELSSRYWASNDEVGRSTIYAKDRLLPWDISTQVPLRPIEMAEPGVSLRLDFSTLPEVLGTTE